MVVEKVQRGGIARAKTVVKDMAERRVSVNGVVWNEYPTSNRIKRGGRMEAKEERAATARRKRRMETVIRVEWASGVG
jgi:hypothetical protein